MDDLEKLKSKTVRIIGTFAVGKVVDVNGRFVEIEIEGIGLKRVKAYDVVELA